MLIRNNMRMDYFNRSPYALANGIEGEEALIDHFRHRQELELRILQDVFPDRSVVLGSKNYSNKVYHGILGEDG